MCRRLEITLKTQVIHGELQVPTLPAHGPLCRELGPHSLLPGMPVRAAVPHRARGRNGRAGEQQLYTQQSWMAVSCCAACKQPRCGLSWADALLHLFLQDISQITSRVNLPLLLLHLFWKPFHAFYSHYSFILLIRHPPRLTVNCCCSLEAAALLPSLVFPKVFLSYFENRQCTSHLL